MKQTTQQGHGFFRKSKAYGLICGIALATALMVGTSTVSANENTGTTNNPATNLVVAQPETSTANTDTAAQAGTKSGELTAPVTSQELTNAVETATEAGVAVTSETTPVAHESLEAAQNDLSAQVHAVETATDKQTANTEAIKEATETNADINRQNQAEAERVAKENAQGQAEVDARNAAGQKAVDERNQKELDRRDEEAKAVEARNQAGQKAVDERNRQGQAEVDERNRLGQAAVEARNRKEQDKREEEAKAVEARNQTGQKAVDERNKQGQAEVDERNRLGQAAVEARNRKEQDKREEEAKAVEARNQAGQKAVDERNKQGQAEVDERNRLGQAAVEARNRKEQNKREEEAKAVEARNQAGQKAVEERNKQGQAEVDERNRLGQAAVDARNKAKQDGLTKEAKDVEARNKAGQAIVDEANRKGQAEVEARNKQGQAEVEARNRAKEELVMVNEAARREAEEHNRNELERVEREWQVALAEWEKAQASSGENDPAYKASKAKYDADKADYDRKVAELNVQKAAAVASNGSTVYLTGTVNEAGTGSLAYYDNMQALFFPTKEVVSLVDGSFYWGDRTRLTSLKNAEAFTDSGKVDSPTDFMMQNFKEGTTFTIENVGIANGESLNLSAKVISAKGIPQGIPNIMTIGKDKTTQAFRFVVYNTAEVELTFDIVTASGTKINTAVSSIVGDLDYGQSSRLTIGEETASFIPANAGISKNGDKFVSDGRDANDFASTPLGTYLVAGISDLITYYHSGDNEYINLDQATRNQRAGEGWNSDKPLVGFAFNLFGKGVSVKNTWLPVRPVPPTPSVTDIPRPEKGKPNLKEVTPVKGIEFETFTPETFTPAIFTPEPHTPEPVKPEIFTPEKFIPETFTPEIYNPEPFVPEVFTPVRFIPETFTPEAYNPEPFKPEVFTPEKFTPESFTPESYNPEPFKPEVFTPEVFTPEAFTPETYNPTPFVPETFTPEIFTPRTPTVIPYVNIPEKETFSVAVHPVLVKQTPGNQKMVTNADGVDVNGQLVVKGEWNTWPLINANLKAGREETKAYTMIDPFPSGIEIDWEKSLELSPAWLRSTDEQGQTLLSATLATINTLNANRQLDVTIPEFKVVFRALNDGATYKNTFDTKILTTNGTYTVTSNTVTIYTPGSEHRTYNGNVVVRYFDETGETKISGDVVDVEDGKVGSSYTTTDNRPDVIAFEGKLYERTAKVVGKEDGKVTDGTIFVDYFYKQVTPTPGQGSVVVHYQDETGKTIKTDVVDEHNQAVGKSYDTTDNRPDVIKTSDGIEYKRTPKVVGSENGKVTEGVTEITYIYTRITPPPTTPTPNDNLIQPEKDVVDEKGQSINGKSVLPNTLLNFVAKQDFDQYKGMSASRSAILKSFLHLDDLKDEALDGKSMVVNSITAANGDDVRELFEMRHVLSLETLEDKLQTLIKEAGISPVGEFYLWVAKDPEAFFKAYVQKGLDITYNLSFKIKQGFTGTVTNQTYQIDFGNGYAGNIVTNEVPPLVVHKQVLDKDGKSIDGSTVKLGDKIDYLLEGWVIPAGRGYDINEYRFVDLLQVSHDKYDSHRISAKVGFTLTDGTVIKAKDDLAAYTETIYNVATGRFETRFKEDFLALIPRSEAFGADVIISVERIAAGEVVNEYTLYVNGNPVISNKVTTTTPEPPKPVTPTTPAPATPAQPQLPSTGDASGILASLAGGLTTVLGLVGFGRKKED